MKKHAIIPVFIPHMGCPHNCVFCNQNTITAKTAPGSADDVREIIEERLPTLSGRGLDTIEIAFFGGSFTGIPLDWQKKYLAVAKEYKDNEQVDKIHISTRPDYINPPILENLKKFGVDIIELGAQSFDDEVLSLSERGHDAYDTETASLLITSYGFSLGIQLMIGLPGDTMAKAINSAKKTVLLKPDIARLYPTVVFQGTRLAEMKKEGSYCPLTENQAVEITKEMYKILDAAGIKIIRVGLKSTDLVNPQNDLCGNYHPAFRQLVEGAIAREKMEELIRAHGKKERSFCFTSNKKSFSGMIGHKGCNRDYFQKKYPSLTFSYIEDEMLPDRTYKINVLFPGK
ncbi:MAG: radical SAM protein [Clostridiales bacterium]|nr:radical SAM protein [Clostridiales bacterium]